MKRRNFLLGISALTIGSVAGGCNQTAALTVEILKGSVPVQMASKFRSSQLGRPAIDFVPKLQLKALYQSLQTSKSQPATDNAPQTDLVMMGDYWLQSAIQQKLIQPLNVKSLSQWSQLPERWQKIVQRNNQGYIDPKGQIWAAPYRWGTTVIIYRPDKFKTLGWTPKDWSDLWRPELRDRISLPDQAREVIGLTLKKLGYSYNTADLNTVKNLESELRKLHQNVKLYDSNNYLKPLILGDTWLAVGWSTDISPEVQYQNDLVAVVPQSGTALWTDVWVKPASVPSNGDKDGNATPTLADRWIDFCWQPQVATQMSLLTDTTSPIVVGMKPEELPKALRNNSLLLPSNTILENSNFIQPLSKSSLEQYQKLWEKIRRETRVT